MFEHLILGCHNLTGGSSSKRSLLLVRAALDLGVKRFDVAPSYGLGTAEDTLSRALGGDRFDHKVQITTKFGIPRPLFGGLLSWVREPYRLVKSVSWGKRVTPPARSYKPTYTEHISSLSGAQSYGKPRASLEDSLRKLRVDGVDSWLTHEFLPENILFEFGDCAEKFLDQGKITRVGCSGSFESVKKNLNSLGSLATIAQFSITDADREITDEVIDLRHFHLSVFANHLGQRLSTKRFERLRTHLNDISGGQHDKEMLPLLAAALALSIHAFPGRGILVNASSSHRLNTLLNAASRRDYTDWAQAAAITELQKQDA